MGYHILNLCWPDNGTHNFFHYCFQFSSQLVRVVFYNSFFHMPPFRFTSKAWGGSDLPCEVFWGFICFSFVWDCIHQWRNRRILIKQDNVIFLHVQQRGIEHDGCLEKHLYCYCSPMAQLLIHRKTLLASQSPRNKCPTIWSWILLQIDTMTKNGHMSIVKFPWDSMINLHPKMYLLFCMNDSGWNWLK